MQEKIRRIKGEIRQRMIDMRDYYRYTLEGLIDGEHEPGTEIFRGWLEAKMRDAERTIRDLTPKTLLSSSAATSVAAEIIAAAEPSDAIENGEALSADTQDPDQS